MSKVENKLRGLDDDEFAKAFMKSELHQLYEDHKDELFLGVRNNYLNLYYNCDSIAEITYKKGKKSIVCEIDRYYLDGISRKDKDKEKKAKNLQPGEICKKYEKIKKYSNERNKVEKKAQSILINNNNRNESSNWFCIDIEYAKSYENKAERKDAKCSPRFDIIAISKKSPHKVALIELKYGNKAIGGKSGIYKHIEDDIKFCKKGFFESQLKKEIVNIIKNLSELGVDIPSDISSEAPPVLLAPEFYFITLNNNAKNDKASTPKQTMGGYLFNKEDNHWKSIKFSEKTILNKYRLDVTKKSSEFHATFLFSKQTLDKITIKDIIDDDSYEKIIPS